MQKRALQVRLIKTNKDETPVVSEHTFDLSEKVSVIGDRIDKSFERLGRGVILYVVADTARRVIIARATK